MEARLELEMSPVELPTALAQVRSQALAFASHSVERSQTTGGWTRDANRFGRVSGRIRVEDGGETISLGELSPGCRACKLGKWDCVFLSLTCNLTCDFCLTPSGCDKRGGLSALGNDLDALAEEYTNSEVIGIGISGGEPLLEPNRLLACISRFRARRPNLYLWVYTNGLLLTVELLSALARAGLNELRFNMAATGYSHSKVTEMLLRSVEHLPTVTVEIPAIPEEAEKLRKALPFWSRAGVKHLNIHELVYEPGTPSGSRIGARAQCRMPDGHACEFNPHSSDLVLDLVRDIESGGMGIALNYCSLASKARQLRGRRRMLASHTLRPCEQLREDGEAESVCYFGRSTLEFAHPMTLQACDSCFNGNRVALVRRLLPLNRKAPGQWTHFQLLPPAVLRS